MLQRPGVAPANQGQMSKGQMTSPPQNHLPMNNLQSVLSPTGHMVNQPQGVAMNHQGHQQNVQVIPMNSQSLQQQRNIQQKAQNLQKGLQNIHNAQQHNPHLQGHQKLPLGATQTIPHNINMQGKPGGGHVGPHTNQQGVMYNHDGKHVQNVPKAGHVHPQLPREQTNMQKGHS